MASRVRRSARIASISQKQTESPASHHQLASVAEVNEASEPSKPNNMSPRARAVDTTMTSPISKPVTPSSTAPVKLPVSEMHPSKVHQTMAPPSSGLRNGFTDIDYTTNPVQSLVENTPSKTPVPSSEFSFRYARPGADKGLSTAAQKLMDELRYDVAKNKTELAEERAREMANQELGDGRKIATAKGAKGRFSAAHQAEFQKMDSIAQHASLFRASSSRFTPAKATATDTTTTTVTATATATTSAKTATPFKAGVKRSQSSAGLEEPESARTKIAYPRLPSASPSKDRDESQPASKRARQRIEDDVSSLRPVSRDGTLIPRPKSNGNDSLQTGIPRSQTLGNIMTPTKSSLARSISVSTPSAAMAKSPSQPETQNPNSFSAKIGRSLLRSPTKIDPQLLARSPKKGFAGFTKWGSPSKSSAQGQDSVAAQVTTPSRLDRLKSALKRRPTETTAKSSIPLLSASAAKTPNRPGLAERMFASAALTTPGRKHASRHVDFTTDTKPPAPEPQSPSPVKLGAPRITGTPKPAAPQFVGSGKAASKELSTGTEVKYPDLSAYEEDADKPQTPQASVPGTFTFRADHTIRLDSTPTKGFGSAAGQSSLRKVRDSTALSAAMPGSFPAVPVTSPEASPNKENKDPLSRSGIPHGMTTKKRQRAEPEEDEVDDEGAKRGSKKARRNLSTAHGNALAASKHATQASSPTKSLNRSPKKMTGSAPQTPSPQKKKVTGLRMSRLQMLAQPKIRK